MRKRNPKPSASVAKTDNNRIISSSICFFLFNSFIYNRFQFTHRNPVQASPPPAWHYFHHSTKFPGAHLHLIPAPTPRLQQLPLCFLSLEMCFFWTSPIKGILQYIVFCIWHNIFACISTSFLFRNTILYWPTYWLIGIWVISNLGFLWKMLLWIFVDMALCVCVSISVRLLKVELQGHVIFMF